MLLSGCDSMIELEVNKVAEHRSLPCAPERDWTAMTKGWCCQ